MRDPRWKTALQRLDSVAFRALIALAICSGLTSANPSLPQASSCAGDWEHAFTGGDGQVDGQILDLAVFDDGNGPLLYACGTFENANGYPVDHLAQWNRVQWLPLPSGGLNGTVRALAVFDAGSGPSLFAAGDFLLSENGVFSNLARYDGTSWSPTGVQVAGSIRDMEVFDSGQGRELVLAGFFPAVSIGGTSMYEANNVVRWSGTSLRRLGGGTNERISALEVFDDGTGPSLYVTGRFTIAAPVTAHGVARWDGASWHALGTGLGGPQWGGDLEIYDDGGGLDLYVSAGNFSTQNSLFRWDGAAWTPLDCGVGCPTEVSGTIQALRTYDDGSAFGEALYLGGTDLAVGGLMDQGVLRWNGARWSGVGGGLGSTTYAFESYDDGNGIRLCAGGGSPFNAGFNAEFALWDGSSWFMPPHTGLNSSVAALQVHDDGGGGGEQLYLGGYFTNANAVPDDYIARWNGSSYSAVGGGFDSWVYDLAEFDDGLGGGNELYAAGEFTMAGGLSANRIAKWDGSTWSALGQGLDGPCYALASYDDGLGGGPLFFAGGDFDNAGGVPAASIAVWDGTQWGSLVGGGTSAGGEVRAMAVYDDGTGPALFIGGLFLQAGGVPATNVARWDGTSWQPLGGGVYSVNQSSRAWALYSYDDGTDSRLLVGGDFDRADGFSLRSLAAWDGTNWSIPFGVSSPFTSNSVVRSMHAASSGLGLPQDLYVAAYFFGSSSPRPYLSRWSGAAWSTLGSSRVHRPLAVSSYDVDSKPAIIVGGALASTPAGDAHIALWRPCALLEDLCFGDGGDAAGCTPCPCGNDALPGTRGGCLNSMNRSASLTGSGSTDLLAADLRFELVGTTPNSVGLLISGPAVLPVMGPCPAGTGLPSLVFDGLRCVGPGIARHGSRPTDAFGQSGDRTPGWGPPDGPPGGLALQSGFTSGQTRFFQVIYRDDPSAQCGTGLNTTNAVRVLFR